MTTTGIASDVGLGALAGRTREVEFRLVALAQRSDALAGDMSWRARAADRYRIASAAWAEDLAVLAGAVGALRADLVSLTTCLPVAR